MDTYFAVVSLMQDLEQLLKFHSDQFYADIFGPHQFLCPFTKKQVEILYENVCLMDTLLRDSSGESYNQEITSKKLEKMIRDVVCKAGNYVDLWAVLCLPEPDMLFTRVTGGDFGSAEIRQPRLTFSIYGDFDPRQLEGNGMLDRDLLGGPPKVISIIGAGGIGKTTLSEYLYHHTSHQFHVRLWVTVSREYQLREILIGILRCVTDGLHEIYEKSNKELSRQVYKSLMGKRYLIVLDDIWQTRAWDDLTRSFPDNVNGSKIILTSRFRGVAVHASQTYYHYQLPRNGSDPLSSKVFRHNWGPKELQEFENRLLFKYEGSPQVILIGRRQYAGRNSSVLWILSKPEMKGNVSKRVMRILRSLVMIRVNRHLLDLSYDHLPDHLKKCFLFMGNFPEGYEISAKVLIWLWVSRGFIMPTMQKSLKEVADHYLEDLIVRDFIMVGRNSSDGRIKSCYIHDLMRQLCLRESRKYKFFNLLNQRRYSRDKHKVSLTQIVGEIDSINKELKKIHDQRKVENINIASFTGGFFTSLSPLRRTTNAEDRLVGLEEDFETMLDSLTGHPSKLRVFPIIGMAGIGKTTFSRKLYDSPLIMHHFYVRVWITVSQQYQVRELLSGILHCVTNSSDEIYEQTEEELKEQVYRCLKGKRYLVVLDDMWDTKVWDDLRRTLPDDNNGSRIVFTSRLRAVADHVSQDTTHCLRCLSIYESWELLSLKIFGDESCPVELLEIGKQIAYKCQGLPLAIVIVGGLLSKMNKRLDIWEGVAQSVGSLVMENAEHCENILALSYSHLPDPLKMCFLYIGMFPEDFEIPVKRLIWLWVAEGFIRPDMLSLEEIAEDYLEDLTARSLVMVKKRSSDGRIKTCYIHDLMRELCVRESQKQNFLHVINNCGQLQENSLYDDLCLPLDVQQHLRRLSFHSSIQKYIHKTSLPYIRSVLCFEKVSWSDPQGDLGMDFKLLKVLDIMNVHLMKIPADVRFLTRLKFLALTIQNYFNLTDLCAVRSLQTLIVDGEWDGHLHMMFWDMLELRHFHLKRICLPYSQSIEFQSPSTSVSELPDDEAPLRDLSNLQSLSTIRPISCTKKVFLSMPNLKKLGIHEFEEDHRFRGWFKNLVHLRELKKLNYVFGNPFANSVFKPDHLPSWDCFPPNLAKLTLSGTSLPWEEMVKLSMLPKLEVLKLKNYAFSGAVWKSCEGGFLCLKFLLIGSTDLEIWEADGTPFPNLEHLVLRHCRSLEEIPREIGEAPLLEKIELHCCKDSAVNSARALREEQLDLGNEMLTIRTTKG